MSKLGAIVTFLFGVIVGGTTVWCHISNKYARIAEEEIHSVKEAYAKHEKKLVCKSDIDLKNKEESSTVLTNNKVQKKGDITEYARLQGVDKYTRYSQIPYREKREEEQNLEAPYVISPYEFGELDGYNKVSLMYFKDGVLSDEYGAIVDDIEEIVGDALDHFGEYEDDSVFCRSDPKKCDYEILKDLRAYDEFLRTLPSNI